MSGQDDRDLEDRPIGAEGFTRREKLIYSAALFLIGAFLVLAIATCSPRAEAAAECWGDERTLQFPREGDPQALLAGEHIGAAHREGSVLWIRTLFLGQTYRIEYPTDAAAIKEMRWILSNMRCEEESHRQLLDDLFSDHDTPGEASEDCNPACSAGSGEPPPFPFWIDTQWSESDYRPQTDLCHDLKVGDCRPSGPQTDVCRLAESDFEVRHAGSLEVLELTNTNPFCSL